MFAIGLVLVVLVFCAVTLDEICGVQFNNDMKSLFGLMFLIGVLLCSGSIVVFSWKHLP